VQVIEEDAKIGGIHANSERFDTKSELSFKYLQVGAGECRCTAGQTSRAAAFLFSCF
jgi:hypothetical protein